MEAEAWGLYALVDGKWWLQFPVRATREDAEDDGRRLVPGTEWCVAPLGEQATKHRTMDDQELRAVLIAEGMAMATESVGAEAAKRCTPNEQVLQVLMRYGRAVERAALAKSQAPNDSDPKRHASEESPA